MKLNTLHEGDLVVVTDSPNAVLYVVLEVEGFNALIQEAGTNYRPHWQDISIMKPPTKKQLRS